MFSIKSTLISGIKTLNKAKIKSAQLDALLLLSFTLKKPKEFLFTYPEKNLTTLQLKKFNKLINQRSKYVPVAYLTNSQGFYGLNFFVNKNVLIPRPETEILVENVLNLLHDSCSIIHELAEVGTGSGCIAIAIAKNAPNVKILATDISHRALSVAKKNSRINRTDKQIKFFRGNLLTPIKNIRLRSKSYGGQEKIDILIANLPYISKNWKNYSIDKKGLSYEPKKALFAGENGLQLYRELFEQIIILKHQPKYILCEFDPRQTKDFQKLIARFFPKATVEILNDLAGCNRAVKIII